jgi:hypothetical protein
MALLKSLVGISDGAERLKSCVLPCGFSDGEKSLLTAINGSPAQSWGACQRLDRPIQGVEFLAIVRTPLSLPPRCKLRHEPTGCELSGPDGMTFSWRPHRGKTRDNNESTNFSCIFRRNLHCTAIKAVICLHRSHRLRCTNIRAEEFQMKLNNPSYLAVARVLDDAGIPHTRVPRGKHEAVQFSLNGVKTSVFLSVSSSDVRAPRAARALVRRILRQRRSEFQPEA